MSIEDSEVTTLLKTGMLLLTFDNIMFLCLHSLIVPTSHHQNDDLSKLNKSFPHRDILKMIKHQMNLEKLYFMLLASSDSLWNLYRCLVEMKKGPNKGSHVRQNTQYWILCCRSQVSHHIIIQLPVVKNNLSIYSFYPLTGTLNSHIQNFMSHYFS